MHIKLPLDFNLTWDFSLLCALLCLFLPLPVCWATSHSNWDRTPLSFLLGSSFRILVFTTCIHKFSSWQEVLRVTTRFSQLSRRLHISRIACIASSRGNLVATSSFTCPINVFMCSTMLSPSLFFNLTIFLIKDVLLRAFFLCTTVIVFATSRGHLCRSPYVEGNWHLRTVWWWCKESW